MLLFQICTYICRPIIILMKKLLSILCAMIGLAHCAHAQTYYVNSFTGSDASTGTSWSTAFNTLTKALAVANTSTSAEVDIWVAQGLYTPVDGIPSSLLPADIADTSFCMYRGNGTGRALKVYGGFAGTETSLAARTAGHVSYLDGVVGASSSHHIIVIAGLAAAADSVVIDGFTIQNGDGGVNTAKTYNGVSIYQSAGAGLAIVNNASSKIAVRNCLVANNNARGIDVFCTGSYGGTGFGGGAYISASRAAFSNCTFSSNKASGGRGGCNMWTWTAPGVGGNAFGGAMYVDTSYIVLDSCTFAGNSATGALGSAGGIWSSVQGDGRGGGIYITGSQQVATNCRFIGNFSTCAGDFNPGGRANGGGVYNLRSATTYSGCVFDHNSAMPFGGATYNDNCNPIFSNCIFSNDSVFGYDISAGGAMYNTYANPLVSNCMFSNNTTATYDSTLGAAMYNDHSSPTVIADTFSNNTLPGPQGYGGAVVNVTGSQPVFSWCIFSKNLANSGGAIYNKDGATPVYKHCIISDNRIISNEYFGGRGGAVYNKNANARFTGCNFLRNRSDVYGGGICNIGSRTVIDSCNFNGNIANGNGGAIYQYDSVLRPTNCVFSSDSAAYPYYWGGSGSGGAIYLTGPSGTFTSYGNVYVDNYAWGGAALSIVPGLVVNTDTIIGNVFIGNKAEYNAGACALGAARHYVYNNTLYNNTAGTAGGAMMLGSTGGNYRVVNNIFYGNISAGTAVDTAIIGPGVLYFAANSMSTTNPMFVNAANPIGTDGLWRTTDDGLELQACSPAADAGMNSFVVPDGAVDIAGHTRITGTAVDLGAYELNATGAISGPSLLCLGSSATLTDTTTGGSWSTSDELVATVNTFGVVTALHAGTATISYSHTGACGTNESVKLITVERPVTAIAGADSVCVGSAVTLYDSVSGGVWNVSNTIRGTVDLAGVFTGLSQGLDTVSYSVTNICGLSIAHKIFRIQAVPGPLSGADTVCRGIIHIYTDSVTGGSWSLSNTVLATVTSNHVTGFAQGTDTLFYTTNNACGLNTVAKIIVIEQPAAPFSLPDSICITSTSPAYVSDSAEGGVYTQSNNTVLFVDASTHYVYPYTGGIDTIYYTTNNSCGLVTQEQVVYVDTFPSMLISGPDTVCLGSTSLLHVSGPASGTWSSSVPGVATIAADGTLSAVATGMTNIVYTYANACGTFVPNYNVTVKTLPTAGTVTGPDTVCQGESIVLAASGGDSWNIFNTNAALSSPTTGSVTVTGNTPGTDTVYYVTSNMCGITRAPHLITIYSVAHCDSTSSVPVVVGAGSGTFSVYPNPTQGTITMEIQAQTVAELPVIMSNMLGQKVKEWTIATNRPTTTNIDVPAGTYVITVLNGQERYITRITVE
jgi:hypothetical protein